jgi:hypothetical protein
LQKWLKLFIMPEKVNGNKFSGKSNIASLNSTHSPVDSKSAVQLNSTEQKLATVQKMADNSPYSQRFAHFTSIANNSTPKQPVSQLSKDSHSLPDNVKHGVESLSGISMDDVKVHYNSAKPAQLNAHAYAQGTDIHIASGQEKHLPHEAWHVVQQKQGRVQPTTMMKAKVPINDDQGLEKEADVMGARALQMKPFSLSDHKTGKSVQRKGVVQKVGEKKPRRDKDRQYSKAEDPDADVVNVDDFNLARNIGYINQVNELVHQWKSINFAGAITTKDQITRLQNFNTASMALNIAGIGLGAATVITFCCVTGGIGGAAILAVLTAWQLGVACSGAGLGLVALKAATTEKQSKTDAAVTTGKQGLENLVGNSASILKPLAEGAGVAAGGLGGLFASFGLRGDYKDMKKLKEKQGEVLDDFQMMSHWLNDKADVLNKMITLEDNILLKNAGSDEEKNNYLEAIKTVIEPTLTIINSEIGKLGVLKGKIGKPIKETR